MVSLLASIVVLIICAVFAILAYRRVNTTTPQGWIMLALLIVAVLVAIIVLLALVGVNLGSLG